MRKILFLVCISLLAALTQAQNSRPLYVYTQDGLYDIFYTKDVKSISYTNTDTSGVEQPQVVTQFIKAGRGSCKLPIESIDSVSFIDPDPQTMCKEGKVNILTSKAFRSLVWDYLANPDQVILKSPRPVIVDFWAKWCTVCTTMKPVMEQLAMEYKGRIDFYSVDTDEETEVSDKLGFTGLPCFYFFPNEGKPVAKEGAMGISYMREIIEKVLLITDDENPDAAKPEMSLELTKGNLDHEWTDRYLTAHLKCTTGDATLVKYGSFLKREIEGNGLTDREIIQHYGDVLKEPQLSEVNSDKGVSLAFRAQKGETYAVICLVKNAEGGVTVCRKEITTDTDYTPAIELHTARGALAEYIHNDGQHISFYIKTNHATEVKYGCMKKTDYEAEKAKGRTIAQLLNERGTTLLPDQVKTANTLGYSAVVGQLEELTDYVCMAMMCHTDGKVSTAHKEVSTAFEGYNEEIPYPSLQVFANWLEGAVSYSVECTSSDAIYCSLLMLPSDEVSALLSKGSTLEEMMQTHPDVSVFNAQQMEWINAQGVAYVYSDLKPSTRYTWIAEVRGRFGGQVVKRIEMPTLAEGVTTPAVELRLHADYIQGMISVVATCLTANATDATLALIESRELEKLLASGNTLEALMKRKPDTFECHTKLTTEQLQWLNQDGFYTAHPEQKPSTRYTWIAKVQTAQGHELVLRSEIQTPRQPNR